MGTVSFHKTTKRILHLGDGSIDNAVDVIIFMQPIAKGLNQLDSFGVQVEIIQIMKAQGNASQS